VLQINEDQQWVMDRDIQYAAAAGVDYWVVNYRLWPREKSKDPTWQFYTPDLPSLMRNSPLRDQIKYCLFLQDHLLGPKNDPKWDTEAEWEKSATALVALFQESNYLKVLGGRPLLFVLDAKKFSYFKTLADTKAGFDRLGEKCREAGLAKPYLVAFTWLRSEKESWFDSVGYDALSGYGAPIHPQIHTRDHAKVVAEHPYAQLAEANEMFREACRKAGRQVIPPVSDGFDCRPAQVNRFPLYDRPAEGPWYTRGTAQEFGANVKAACQWVVDHPSSAELQSILIYNWSEYVEGGWLCPTLDEGTARLDALKNALEGFRPRQ
jgi:hypothetical protein